MMLLHYGLWSVSCGCSTICLVILTKNCHQEKTVKKDGNLARVCYALLQFGNSVPRAPYFRLMQMWVSYDLCALLMVSLDSFRR